MICLPRPLPVRASRLASAAALGLLVLGGCHGSVVQEQITVVTAQLEKARLAGAAKCAGRDFAIAEANNAFAKEELLQGNAGRAEEHMLVASKAVEKALLDSRDCLKTVRIAAPAPAPVIKVEKKDTDGDGLLDTEDKCIREPEDKDGFEDADGCPDFDNDKDGLPDVNDACPNEAGPVENRGCPVRDTDGDGIPDDIDRCRLDPEDRDGFEDDDGCPEVDNDFDGTLDVNDNCPVDPGPRTNQGCPVLDRDGDGLNDPADRCPDVPEDKDGFEDLDGCPDVDNDQDEILDPADACPNEPGIPETKGCPPQDRDGDGIPDHIDRCPDEPGVVSEQGCPRKFSLIVLKQEKIEIKEQVRFETNKHKILPPSFGLMDQIVQILKDYPKIKLRIEGHTDSKADDKFNMKLSQRRADAVREYLQKAGISASRLVSVGFGETQPIAPNANEKGRAQNRRVEFNITER
jgi:outer membrane protein OmpA-like peptidoglycan-associated protein